METSSDSSGQRLRWWQEDTPKPQKWYSDPALDPVKIDLIPTVSQTLSFEEELEAEALRRTALERDTVVVEGSYTTTISKVRRRLAWIFIPIALMNLTIGILGQSWVNALIPLIFVAEYFLITAIMRKQFATHKPQIALSSLGLTLDLPYYRFGPVFWDEIASVRVVNWWFVRYVSVKLKDPNTHKRALTVKPGALGWLTRFAMSKTHIEIMDQWFPESAEEIAARIATFRPVSPGSDKK
ncbi:MAG: hypothetical protein H8F28_02465 [Fibrella sp.]|nr:hypothetical protein [Armatimonadota bacterium]